MEVVSKTKPFSSQSSSLLLLPEVVGGWKLSDCQVKTQRSCHNNNSSLNFSHWKKDTQSSRLMDLATEVISSDGYCLWWTNTCCHQSLSVISVCWISLLKNEESLASEQFADHPVPFLSLSAGRLWQTQTLSLRGRITLVYFVQTEEEVWSDFVDSSGWRNMPRPLVWCTCRTNALRRRAQGTDSLHHHAGLTLFFQIPWRYMPLHSINLILCGTPSLVYHL